MRVFLLIALLLLTACGGMPTSSSVEAALQGAGASAFVANEAAGTAPKSYISHAEFMIGDKPGQYFMCDTKQNCDAIYAYYDALKALAGPYTYRSGSGLVVAQLSSELPPAAAARIADALNGL